MTLQKIHLRFLLIVSIAILALPFVSSRNMWVKIYSSNHKYTDPADLREVFTEVCTMNEVGETTCSIPTASFPCGRDGLYYGAVFGENGPALIDASGAYCNGIAGDFGTIYNCFAYVIDFDTDEPLCKQTNPACLGTQGGIWETDADYGQGECCGDDPPGINPDGTVHTIDDPDMGQLSCEYCEVGLNNISAAKGPGGSQRDWSSTVNGDYMGEGCCGDDYGDCAQLLYANSNQWLCWDFGGTYYIPSTLECSDPNPENCQTQPETGSYTPGTWFWSPADVKLGVVFNISCARIAVVSSYGEWLACENASFGLNAQRFTGALMARGQTDIYGHEYLCYFNRIPGIAECCGGNTSNPQGQCNSTIRTSTVVRDYGGVRKKSGGSIVHNISRLQDVTTYYCTSSFKWDTNLDVYDKYTCEQAGFKWTGHHCCSEADDVEEFYSDPTGLGICFNKTYYGNNNFLNRKGHGFRELYIYNGTLQGCAIDEDNAGGNPNYPDPNKPYNGSLTLSNDWLLSFKDYPDSGQNKNADQTGTPLVRDNNYCTATGPSNRYFCSYTEVWMDGQGKNRTHLSYIGWTPQNPDTQRAECCERFQCWDGQACVDSFHVDSSQTFTTPDGRVIRCIFGQWSQSEPKYNWNKKYAGYCLDQSQCLVDPNGMFEHNNIPKWYASDGNPTNPQCIGNGQYIQDHYCDNGNWTTRTKLLALQLLDYAGSDDFTIFCDSYSAALNYCKYDFNALGSSQYTYTHPGRGCSALYGDEDDIYKVYLGNERKTSCRTNCTAGVGGERQEVNCANNFCVLQTRGITIVGVSLNQPINSPYYPFLDLFGMTDCGVAADGNYHSCGNSRVWYNSNLQSVIFSSQSIDIGPANWWDVFTNKVKSWMDAMVSFFQSPGIVRGEEYPFVSDSPQMQKFYMEKSQNKAVFAVLERDVYYDGYPNDYLSVTYQGFQANICDAFAAYPGLAEGRPSVTKYRCELSGTDTYKMIAQTGSPVLGLWRDFTAKLRVQP